MLTEELNADYYTSDLVGVQVDVALLDELASAHPSLRAAWEAIEASGFQLQLVSQQWLLLAFVGALPTETTFRVWDLLFVAGSPALLAASLALLRTLAGPLAAGGADFERVYAQLKCVHAAVLDADAFLRRTLVELRALPPQTLRRMRAPHRERIAADLAARRRQKEEYAARKLASTPRGVRAVARRAGGGAMSAAVAAIGAPRRRRWGGGGAARGGGGGARGGGGGAGGGALPAAPLAPPSTPVVVVVEAPPSPRAAANAVKAGATATAKVGATAAKARVPGRARVVGRRERAAPRTIPRPRRRGFCGAGLVGSRTIQFRTCGLANLGHGLAQLCQ